MNKLFYYKTSLVFLFFLTTLFRAGQCQDLEYPDGYVMTKDLVFFDFLTQGSEGTIEKTIKNYNDVIVGNEPGIDSTASTVGDMIGPDGNPLDWKLRMDIIHPETPGGERHPLFFVMSTSYVRNLSRFQPFQRIFAKRGYITAVIDHCYTPVALAYGHNKTANLDNITGVKAYTAAMRFFRANAEKYSIDPNAISGLGHSKGAYGITRLSDPTISETSREHSGSSNRDPYGPQPYPGFANNIQVGYQSMGNGTRYSERYVTDDYGPTVTAVGFSDKYDHWGAWPDVVKAYSEDNDANWLGIAMLDKGHEMATGFQPDLGYVREEAVENFFSRYLEPDLPPAVLYVTPYNGTDGNNPVTSTDPVVIHFSPVMDAESVINGNVLVIRRKNQMPVRGTWEIKRKDSYFIFRPELGSFKGNEYLVSINESVKRSNGVAFGTSLEHSFNIPGNDESEEDNYNTTAIQNTGNSQVKTLGLKIHLSPSGVMSIRIPVTGSYQYWIHDTLGNVIGLHKGMGPEVYQIPNLKPGLYFIKITAEHTSETVKALMF